LEACQYNTHLSAIIGYLPGWIHCQGKVYISFIVEKDGSISNKKFAKQLCSGFDEKAMEVIELMKTWQPGTIDQEPVRTLVTIPINFELR
jgi:protein TonB